MSLRPKSLYPPLHFHDKVFGENIKLYKNKTAASRTNGFCDGIVFSDRPIAVYEPIYVKILETSSKWNGDLRIGFTMNDPMSLESNLPQYACPKLTEISGNWAKPIRPEHAKKDSVLYFYVDMIGDVHYGIDTEEYGIFQGVNTSDRLWAMLDIFGNTIAVELYGQHPFSDCIICLEELADCAIYRCGHTCLCYDCAETLKRSSAAHCPICRTPIEDIVKIYKN